MTAQETFEFKMCKLRLRMLQDMVQVTIEEFRKREMHGWADPLEHSLKLSKGDYRDIV